jgi:hypothetical protein
VIDLYLPLKFFEQLFWGRLLWRGLTFSSREGQESFIQLSPLGQVVLPQCLALFPESGEHPLESLPVHLNQSLKLISLILPGYVTCKMLFALIGVCFSALKDEVVTHEVTFNIEADGVALGSIKLGLFGKVVPKTAKNFF